MGEGYEGSAKENREKSKSCGVGEKGKGVLIVMDTPERSKNNQITTSISKFEDSPVFDFLNSLSPIKSVQSIHVSQTINPLSFASLPSVFTSPHVCSLRRSRFLRRHQLSDPLKPEFSSEGRSTVDTRMIEDTDQKFDEQQGNQESRASFVEVVGEQSYEFSKLAVDFAENFNYDCISPCTSSPLVSLVQKTSQRDSYGSEVNLEGVSLIDEPENDILCDWEKLISDASGMSIFESPNRTDSLEKPTDPGTIFGGSEAENLSTRPGDGSKLMEIPETHDVIPDSSMSNPSEKMDSEHLSGFYRGMRRRCLVFGMLETCTNHSDDNLCSDSSMFLSSAVSTSSSDQQLVPTKTGNDSSLCVLPNIGLHLNALATTHKDYKIVKHEASGSGRLLIGLSSSVNFHRPINDQELLDNPLVVGLSEREITADDAMPVEDAGQASGHLANEEINQSSPKKKRRRPEQAGEGESCKRCNCKKSKCLKLYCECFAAGVYCVEPCACIDCFNKPVHEDTVLATRKQIETRNPLAFAPKVIRDSDSQPESWEDSSKTPASARHKRGCNCKKSGCLKKYCECYQGGVGCSINCRCEGCKNAFGRKEGSVIISTEAEYEEDETDIANKNVVDRSLQKTAIENDMERNLDSIPPATPLRTGRQSSVQNTFSSKKKPPRSSFPFLASSSCSYASQEFKKPKFFQPPLKLDKHFETISEDEMPEFLQERSPIAGINSLSPNRKRVSPPHGAAHAGTLSPGLRSSRKLILQSIPSFPSLAPNP